MNCNNQALDLVYHYNPSLHEKFHKYELTETQSNHIDEKQSRLVHKFYFAYFLNQEDQNQH